MFKGCSTEKTKERRNCPVPVRICILDLQITRHVLYHCPTNAAQVTELILTRVLLRLQHLDEDDLVSGQEMRLTVEEAPETVPDEQPGLVRA